MQIFINGGSDKLKYFFSADINIRMVITESATIIHRLIFEVILMGKFLIILRLVLISGRQETGTIDN